MSNNHVLWLRRARAMLCIVVGIACARTSSAQNAQWRASAQNPNSMPMNGGFSNMAASFGMNPQPVAPRRPALARLIENPDQTEGTPPYALTDQNGTVQRYVEPVPGVDLSASVGQIVSVKSDTGPTLLASQLELPRQPLYPMMGQPMRGGFRPANRLAPMRMPNSSGVEQAQYVDGDDSSVQLLPDDMPASNGAGYGPGGPPQLQMLGNGGQYGGPMVGPYDAGGVVDVNPTSAEPQGVVVSGDVEFMFLRPRISEDAVGKLSETYELSPRFILGVRNFGAADVRVRFWEYGRDTNVLGNGEIRTELDVLDLEAVHRFEGRRTEIDVAAGIRLANWKLKDNAGEKSSSDMIGLTMAADGLTKCACLANGYCGWVYGGRLSLLGGDWGGDDNSVFVNHQVRDDNVLVTELYAGAEVGRRCGNFDIRGRVVFEIQNWRSDVLSQDANIPSVGFLGPGLQIGADF